MLDKIGLSFDNGTLSSGCLMYFLWCLLLFSSFRINAAEDSLKEIISERILASFQDVRRSYDETGEALSELSKPFANETSLSVYNNVSGERADFQKLNSEYTSASLTTSKQFRSGGKLEVEANFNEYKSAASAKPFRGEGLAVRVSQPLLKGFRLGNPAVSEKLLKIQQKVDALNALHEHSRALLQPISDYWNLVYAKARRDLRLQVMQQLEALYQEVHPQDDSLLIRDLAVAKRALSTAEEELAHAKRTLEGVIGREVDLNRLDHFSTRRASRGASVEQAFANRCDLKALNLYEQGVSLLMAQSRNEKLPSVDLTVDYKIDRQLQREGVIGLSLSVPTYRERRGSKPQGTSRHEVVAGISNKKGEIVAEIGKICERLEALDSAIAKDRIYQTLNERADQEEECLRQELCAAMALAELDIATGNLLEADLILLIP